MSMFFPKEKNKIYIHIIILIKQDSFSIPLVALIEYHPSFSEAAKKTKRENKFYLAINTVVLAAGNVYHVHRLSSAV